ncbi:MAG: DUF6468 domain-containing protein [Rickettsiales bacterium]|nr:DUF6468 domain-containing protein [Rickettsiales bacterium]
MTVLIAKLLIDSLMVVLLVATIFYCVMVSRRIRVLQDSREEFAQLITKFDETTKRAQESIDDLQKVGKKVNESLNERLDKANFLADDLAFMIEKGNKVADKVDNTLPRADRTDGNSVIAPKREPMIGRNKKKDNAAKESLMRAAGRGKKQDKVDSVLERLGDKQAAAQPRRSRASARLRSKAEQDLQDALKSGNE